jgi:hypothetical protein
MITKSNRCCVKSDGLTRDGLLLGGDLAGARKAREPRDEPPERGRGAPRRGAPGCARTWTRRPWPGLGVGVGEKPRTAGSTVGALRSGGSGTERSVGAWGRGG